MNHLAFRTALSLLGASLLASCARPIESRPIAPTAVGQTTDVLYALPKTLINVEFDYERTVKHRPVCVTLAAIPSVPTELDAALASKGLTPIFPSGSTTEKMNALKQRALLLYEIEEWKGAGAEKKAESTKLKLKKPKLSTRAVPDPKWIFAINVDQAKGARRTAGTFAFQTDGRLASATSSDTNRTLEVVMETVEFGLKIAAAGTSVAASLPAAGAAPAPACDVALREVATIVADGSIGKGVGKDALAGMRAILRAPEKSQTGTLACQVEPLAEGDITLFDTTVNGSIQAKPAVTCVASNPGLVVTGGVKSDAVAITLKQESGTHSVTLKGDLNTDSKSNTDRTGAIYYRAPALFRVELRRANALLLTRSSLPVAQLGKVRSLPAGAEYGSGHVRMGATLDAETGSLRKLEVEFGKTSGPDLGGLGDATAGLVDAAQARKKAKDDAKTPKSNKALLLDAAVSKCAEALAEGTWSDFCALVR